MCEDVRLEVCGLSKPLVAAVKGTHVRPVTSVNAHMCPQVEVQRESFSTPLKSTLKKNKDVRFKDVIFHNTLEKFQFNVKTGTILCGSFAIIA